MYKFKKNQGWDNFVVKINDEIHISYNPHPGFAREDPEETAIVVSPRNNKEVDFLIIQADLRKEIEGCKSFGEILDIIKLYKDKILDHGNNLSLEDFNKIILENTNLLKDE